MSNSCDTVGQSAATCSSTGVGSLTNASMTEKKIGCGSRNLQHNGLSCPSTQVVKNTTPAPAAAMVVHCLKHTQLLSPMLYGCQACSSQPDIPMSMDSHKGKKAQNAQRQSPAIQQAAMETQKPHRAKGAQNAQRQSPAIQQAAMEMQRPHRAKGERLSFSIFLAPSILWLPSLLVAAGCSK